MSGSESDLREGKMNYLLGIGVVVTADDLNQEQRIESFPEFCQVADHPTLCIEHLVQF